ncbi:hypothetical protein [Salibacterium halotolerans]|uniref:Uncharacterized protein n=1 Tax=Salibacterium halotolerans TaxID=1884432 RepID=A0A1I5PL84_9BACI|nr:hypothetical protein [Salibacterium halotolerans]SFP34286.1 hypothetical protein SAMN05518683_104151 [Salibacterium halotolerans]
MQMELWLSIVPPLTAVIFAMWTKQVIPSLLVGLWVESWLYTGSFIESLNQTVVYITGVLTDIGNLDVILFLCLFAYYYLKPASLKITKLSRTRWKPSFYQEEFS